MLPHDSFVMPPDRQWPHSSMSSDSSPPINAPPSRTASSSSILITNSDRRASAESASMSGHAPTATRPRAPSQASDHGSRRSSKASSSAKSGEPARQLQFVNATDPYRNRDPDVRMLVRSHVMKGVKRDEKAKLKAKEKRIQQDKVIKHVADHHLPPPSEPLLDRGESQPQDDAASLPASSSTSPPPPINYGGELSGATMSLYGTSPLTSRPESHKLLFYYRSVIGSAVYPFAKRLAFNPVDTSWIPLALSDDVFFSTILFSAASHLSFIQGQKNATLPAVILQSVFRALGERLGAQKDLTDATVGAVTCLAQVENMRGNEDAWRLHMSGLSSMMASRGLESIDEQMQLKIYRADVEGAVNFVTKSQLPPLRRNQPPLETAIPAGLEACLTNEELVVTLSNVGVRPDLIQSYSAIYRFSRALEYVLMHHDMLINPASYDEDVVAMQLELVGVGVEEEVGLDRALRLAGMMYVKSTIRGAGVAPPSSRRLLLQLKDALLVLPPEIPDLSVHLWILFIGAVGSRGLPEHFWYLQRLRDMMARFPQLRTWDECSFTLRRMLWVEPIHKEPCKLQYDEIGVANLYAASP